MNTFKIIKATIAILFSTSLMAPGKANAGIDYTSGLYWGSGLSRIVLKGVPGSPDFIVPMISANIESGDNLMYQFRLAYGGRGDNFVDMDRSVGLYAKYHWWTGGYVNPFAMVGFTSTKYTLNTIFSRSSDSSDGISFGVGLKFVSSEALHYAVELLGMNREDEEVNTALTVKVYYSF